MRTVISRYITIAIASMLCLVGTLWQKRQKRCDGIPVIKLTVDKNGTANPT